MSAGWVEPFTRDASRKTSKAKTDLGSIYYDFKGAETAGGALVVGVGDNVVGYLLSPDRPC